MRSRRIGGVSSEGVSALADLSEDFRQAFRQIRRAPAISALIIATLAIGLGATVTMAGAIDRVMFRAPPHIELSDDIVRLLLRTREPNGTIRISSSMSYPAFLELQESVEGFESIAGSLPIPALPVETETAILVRGLAVTAGYFDLLGVRPAIGRFFGSDDAYPRSGGAGGPALAVLSYGYWQRWYGANPNVVGQSIRIHEQSYTVVGVAPPGFRGIETVAPDLWLPLTVVLPASGQQPLLDDRGAAFVSVVARLRPFVATETAEQQATAIWRLRNASPPSVVGITDVVSGGIIPGRAADQPREVAVALWLGGLSALVLLIACANVSNLLIGRAHERRRDIALRIALGAGRFRLARLFITETALLAALGGVGAVGLAGVGGALLRRARINGFPPIDGAFVDARLAAFTIAIVVGTALTVSLLPVLQTRRLDLTNALRGSASRGAPSAARVRLMLVMVQSALCVLLLFVATLFAQSLRRVKAIDLGVDLDRTYVARFDLRRLGLPVAEANALYASMAERVRSLPGVRRVSLAEIDPYSGGGRAVAIHTDTRDREELFRKQVEAGEIVIETAVDSGFFRTVGASLRGRDFDANDVAGSQRVAIINKPLADLLFSGAMPLGECVYLPVIAGASTPSGPCFMIIGVLEGFWSRSILNRSQFLVYVPLTQRPIPLRAPSAVFVQAVGDRASTIAALRRAIASAHPGLPVPSVRSLLEVVEPQLRPWRVAATLFSIFGLVALAIAGVGLYAVVSQATAQRSLEIAVRLAMGARLHHIAYTVTRDGLRAVIAGLTIGLLGALALRGWMGPLLFQTATDDPTVLGGIAGILLLVAVLALIVPSTRALRRSPASVLRAD